MEKSYRILVIDDHSMVRNGTRLVLETLSNNVTVLEAKDGIQAKEITATNFDLDLILLDISLPDTTGFELLEYFKNALPNTPVVIISASDESSEVELALKLGAQGFIHKSEDEEIMTNAIHLILSGGQYFPPSLFSKNSSVSNLHNFTPNIGDMTPRQKEVLKLLSEGKPNKVIANQLGCNESTVRVHVTAILKNLGVTNRTEAAIKAKTLF